MYVCVCVCVCACVRACVRVYACVRACVLCARSYVSTITCIYTSVTPVHNTPQSRSCGGKKQFILVQVALHILEMLIVNIFGGMLQIMICICVCMYIHTPKYI